MSQPEAAPVLLLTVPEAARRLGLKSRSTVYEMVHAGELAATEGRGGLRISESALAEYIADRTVKAIPRPPKPVRSRPRPLTIVEGGHDAMARKTVRSTRKRARKGEGTVFYDDARGCWVGQIDLGPDPETGKRRRPKVSGPDEQSVGDLLDELKSERKQTGTVAPRNVTVGHVLAEWLANPGERVKSDITAGQHEDVVRLITSGATAVPKGPPARDVKGIGGRQLSGLKVTDVEGFLRALKDAGYSHNAAVRTRSALRLGIRRVQRDGLVVRNVAELAEIPSGMPTRVSKSLTGDQVRSLLSLDLTPWWRAYIVTAVMAGLRPGELLGLRWEDVDWDEGVIRVRVMLKRVDVGGRKVFALLDLKTVKSKRIIRMSNAVRGVLLALKKDEAARKLRHGPGYGSGLANCSDGLVFPGIHGRPRYHHEVRNGWKARCAEAGIPGDWTLKESRHTFASIVSDSGEPVERISEAMGHANTRITQQVYVHQLSDRIAEVGQVMDDIFPSESGK